MHLGTASSINPYLWGTLPHGKPWQLLHSLLTQISSVRQGGRCGYKGMGDPDEKTKTPKRNLPRHHCISNWGRAEYHQSQAALPCLTPFLSEPAPLPAPFTLADGLSLSESLWFACTCSTQLQKDARVKSSKPKASVGSSSLSLYHTFACSFA